MTLTLALALTLALTQTLTPTLTPTLTLTLTLTQTLTRPVPWDTAACRFGRAAAAAHQPLESAGTPPAGAEADAKRGWGRQVTGQAAHGSSALTDSG